MSQPYRRGARQTSPALLAMLRGRPLHSPHPLDALRQVQRRYRRSGDS